MGKEIPIKRICWREVHRPILSWRTQYAVVFSLFRFSLSLAYCSYRWDQMRGENAQQEAGAILMRCATSSRRDAHIESVAENQLNLRFFFFNKGPRLAPTNQMLFGGGQRKARGCRFGWAVRRASV